MCVYVVYFCLVCAYVNVECVFCVFQSRRLSVCAGGGACRAAPQRRARPSTQEAPPLSGSRSVYISALYYSTFYIKLHYVYLMPSTYSYLQFSVRSS